MHAKNIQPDLLLGKTLFFDVDSSHFMTFLDQFFNDLAGILPENRVL